VSHLAWALGILSASVASQWAHHSGGLERAGRHVVARLDSAWSDTTAALLKPQSASVEITLIAVADEALEDVLFAAPERWRALDGRTTLTDAELAAVRQRLGQVASAGHAEALGRFEAIVKRGEMVGISTHRPTTQVVPNVSGELVARELMVTTTPSVQLQEMRLSAQQLNAKLEIAETYPELGAQKRGTIQLNNLKIVAGDSLLVLLRSPFNPDERINERTLGQQSARHRLDFGHRLVLITPARAVAPKRKGALVYDRGVPKLTEW